MYSQPTLIAHVFLALFLFCGCGAKTPPPNKSATKSDVIEFEQKTGLVIPVSSTDITTINERGPNDAIWIKAKVLKSDVPKFLSEGAFKNIKLNQDKRFLSKVERIIPNSPNVYVGGEALLKGSSVTIVMDEDDTKYVLLYLFWYQL